MKEGGGGGGGEERDFLKEFFVYFTNFFFFPTRFHNVLFVPAALRPIFLEFDNKLFYFIVPFVNHIVLFFLFAFNLFYSFTFLLFGRHALRVGSVERPARNHLRAPFSCLSMETVSQVIPGKKSL